MEDFDTADREPRTDSDRLDEKIGLLKEQNEKKGDGDKKKASLVQSLGGCAGFVTKNALRLGVVGGGLATVGAVGQVVVGHGDLATVGGDALFTAVAFGALKFGPRAMGAIRHR